MFPGDQSGIQSDWTIMRSEPMPGRRKTMREVGRNRCVTIHQSSGYPVFPAGILHGFCQRQQRIKRAREEQPLAVQHENARVCHDEHVRTEHVPPDAASAAAERRARRSLHRYDALRDHLEDELGRPEVLHRGEKADDGVRRERTGPPGHAARAALPWAYVRAHAGRDRPPHSGFQHVQSRRHPGHRHHERQTGLPGHPAG